MSKDKIINIFSEVCNVDVAAETQLDELNIDSLDLTEIIMSIEDDFKIKISEEKWNKFKTVQDVVDFVSLKQ